MKNDDLTWLLSWYHNQCDGDWEHENGIKIGTIDNPGWYLKVMLKETELDKKPFITCKFDNSENDWIYCTVKDDMFQGYGGPFNLLEILKIFRNWAEEKQ